MLLDNLQSNPAVQAIFDDLELTMKQQLQLEKSELESKNVQQPHLSFPSSSPAIYPLRVSVGKNASEARSGV